MLILGSCYEAAAAEPQHPAGHASLADPAFAGFAAHDATGPMLHAPIGQGSGPRHREFLPIPGGVSSERSPAPGELPRARLLAPVSLPDSTTIPPAELIPLPAANSSPPPGPAPADVLPQIAQAHAKTIVSFDALLRGYYLNDHRIEWTGLESTFAAEAALAVGLHRKYDDWEVTGLGDFYLNQPFDNNVLGDTVERRSYLANWDRDIFEISNLYLAASKDNWTFVLGKIETPFGRYYFPLLSNARLDAPFIRTEAIKWRETGVLVNYRRGRFVADVALTNGTEDLDTNSSKALVSRVGFDDPHWALGASVKAQDGTGSEWQKQFNSHVGIDAMVRRGCWTLSAEVIYDEYGTRRAGIDLNSITWGRSIYYRDLNYRHEVPITGVGYYLDLIYQGDGWLVELNYGEFYPQQLGNVIHDQVSRRAMIKAIYDLAPGLSTYAVVMIENAGFTAQFNRPREGTVVLTGFQLTY